MLLLSSVAKSDIAWLTRTAKYTIRIRILQRVPALRKSKSLLSQSGTDCRSGLIALADLPYPDNT